MGDGFRYLCHGLLRRIHHARIDVSMAQKAISVERRSGGELPCRAPVFSLTAIGAQPTRHLIGATAAPAALGKGAPMLVAPIAPLAKRFDEINHRQIP